MKLVVANALALTALILSLIAPLASQASVVYQFSLAANGDVGPIEIRQTVDNFIAVPGLLVTSISDPSISFTSGTPVDHGYIGFEQKFAETLYGVSLQDAADNYVLYSYTYPDHFFRFARFYNQEGTFSSVGLVTSDLVIATRTPVATLCVSSTGACDRTAPEPGTLALLSLGLAGLAASRRRKQ